MKSVNQIRFVALMAAAATLFGGCEKESDNTVDNTPVAARITSTIDDMATRAVNTAWTAGDAIGVSGKSGEKPYVNVKYVTTAGRGEFTAVNDAGKDNNIYFQNKNDVTFTAYYPYDGANGTDPGTNGVIAKTITADDQSAEKPAADRLPLRHRHRQFGKTRREVSVPSLHEPPCAQLLAGRRYRLAQRP